jgi:UPF0755 protein
LRRVVAALVAVALAFGILAFWVREQLFVDRAFPVRDTNVVVPSGATGHDVAALLAARGIIGSAGVFDVLARLKGERSAMKAGEYRFAAHRTLAEVVAQVVAGGGQTARWITIPEGFTAREIAQRLAAARIGDAARFTEFFLHQPLDLGRAGKTVNLEGFLFPDTYLVALAATPAQVAALMTERFREELPPGADALARRLGLTVPQVVTLASLVEREAQADDERPLMAGVYYNRLRRGMPLQVDATIEYALPQHKDVITYADLALPTPYNTYRHAGLPPTPIANPGRPSLLAAFYPRPSGYLYYVSEGNGHHAFSRTLAEHNANVARYLR